MVKIRYRILLGFVVIIAGGFYFLTSWTITDLRVQPLKASEEALVDTAHLLAAFLEIRLAEEGLAVSDLRQVMARAARRHFLARIYQLDKQQVNLRVYVTDPRGVVVFDSDGGRDEGVDYSEKNDVYLTLRGRYGARATKMTADDFYSTVLHVAAPVHDGDGRLRGVLTVAKPVESVKPFITEAVRNIVLAAVLAFLAAGVLSFVIADWISQPLQRLIRYSRAVRDGERVGLPRLGGGEAAALGEAFEEMRDALAGRKYLEHSIQTLTHELKSPLSSIQGAAELLTEEMEPPQRRKFIGNIRAETGRIQRLVDRLLRLVELENRKTLENVEPVRLDLMLDELADSLGPLLRPKNLSLDRDIPAGLVVTGEGLLIRQAVLNLLQNSIDFSAAGGRITVSGRRGGAKVILEIADEGAGIPEYARDRVFEKFYSLPRPDTRRKSTGLGLSLVREVAELHGGDILLLPNEPRGTRARLAFHA